MEGFHALEDLGGENGKLNKLKFELMVTRTWLSVVRVSSRMSCNAMSCGAVVM